MSKNITTAPLVQTLTATAVLADSTYNLSQTEDGSGRRSMNFSSPLILNLDLTLGRAQLNLFAISTLLDGYGAGVGFHIHGNIIGAYNIDIYAFNSEAEVNTVCGDAFKRVGGAGTAFMLWVSGRYNWGLVSCELTPSIP